MKKPLQPQTLKQAEHDLELIAFGIVANKKELEQARADIARAREWLNEKQERFNRLEKRLSI